MRASSSFGIVVDPFVRLSAPKHGPALGVSARLGRAVTVQIAQWAT